MAKITGNIKTWARLARAYIKMDLTWFLRDTRTCVAWLVCDTVVSLCSVVSMYLLAQRFGGFGGFSGAELLFMLGWALLASGLFFMLFASNNIGQVSRIIGRGQLDHVLVMPVPLHLHFLAAGIAPFSASGPFLFGVGLTVYAGTQLALPTTAGWWALAALLLVCGASIELACVYAVSTLAFWAPYAAEEIAGEVTGLFDSLSTLPLGGMGAAVRLVLCTALPIGAMAWLPSSILLGKTPALNGALLLCLTASALCTVAVLLFKKGMKYYAKYSCPRYSGFGR